MQTVRFGQTAMTVSRLCLGTMGFGGDRLQRPECQRVVDEALDHGVNFIDTAEGYGDSEAILGDVLRGKRDRVFIATKVFTPHTHDGACGRNSRHNILASVDDSLHRLQTDYIDLYQLHHPDPETAADETLAALDELVRAGKVRYVGCSNHYAWQVVLMTRMARERGWPPMVSNQVCYNILDRPAEADHAAVSRIFNIPLMAYSPLCGGLLTGKYTRRESLPEGAAIATRFGGKIRAMHESEEVHDILEGLEPIAAEEGVSLIQLAMLWLMAKPFVGVVLVGGTRPEHFGPSYEIADRALAAETVERIDALSENRLYKPFRNQKFNHAPALSPWS